MRVVSVPVGRERVHFEARDARRLKREMSRFLRFLERDDGTDPVRSGLAHLWFVTIHPFDDGNGREPWRTPKTRSAACARAPSLGSGIGPCPSTRMLARLLEGFEGKLTTTKWAKLTKTSPDTALRDIQQLIDLRILARDPAGGRSTSYSLRPI